MGVIDTSQWKEFRLGDLFDIYNGKKYVSHQRVVGDLPLVSNSSVNNGVGDFIAEREDNVWSNFITVAYGSGTGVAFYHSDRVFVGETVMALVPKFSLTKSIGLFIAACLTSYGVETYKYERKPKVDEYRKSVVLSLPATPDGQPDWAYMDAYMGEVLKKEEVFAEHLASLTGGGEAVVDGHPLDTSAWKAFRIGDLFEKLSLGFKANRKFDKGLDVDTKPSDEFDLPLVNAKDGNNGIMYWGRSADWDSAEMTLDIVMDGAVSAGNVYAQPQHTGVLYNAYLIKPLCSMSANCLQFVATVMQSAIKEQFGYMNKCTWDRVSALPIYLPVTSDGQPDWAWMEQYMRQQLDMVEPLSEHLIQLF